MINRWKKTTSFFVIKRAAFAAILVFIMLFATSCGGSPVKNNTNDFFVEASNSQISASGELRVTSPYFKERINVYISNYERGLKYGQVNLPAIFFGDANGDGRTDFVFESSCTHSVERGWVFSPEINIMERRGEKLIPVISSKKNKTNPVMLRKDGGEIILFSYSTARADGGSNATFDLYVLDAKKERNAWVTKILYEGKPSFSKYRQYFSEDTHGEYLLTDGSACIAILSGEGITVGEDFNVSFLSDAKNYFPENISAESAKSADFDIKPVILKFLNYHGLL